MAFVSELFTKNSLDGANLLRMNGKGMRSGVYKTLAKKYSDCAGEGFRHGCRLSIFLFFPVTKRTIPRGCGPAGRWRSQGPVPILN